MGFSNCRQKLSVRLVSALVTLVFGVFSLCPPAVLAGVMAPLPMPGAPLALSPAFEPVQLLGIQLHPDNPLRFDFLITPGETQLSPPAFREESTRLIKYFLAALTVPETEMWVNLSPYEKDRIIPPTFGQTEMGRDVLALDYMLKQLTASLMNPENELGETFWQRVRAGAMERFGTDDVPLNTFHKIWIVPQRARVYEHARGAVVVDSHLKVMLEEDYLALEANQGRVDHGVGEFGVDGQRTLPSGIAQEIIREVLIPEIEREVNQGATFANLRQIYSAVILASWFKQALRESVLGQAYVDQGKVRGVNALDEDFAETIYQQYLSAYETGASALVRDEYDPVAQNVIPRQYFSGGLKLNPDVEASRAMLTSGEERADFAMQVTGAQVVTADLGRPDRAMLDSVKERVKNIYQPWLERRLGGQLSQMQGLYQSFWNLLDSGASDDIAGVQAQIENLVDRINIDTKFQDAVMNGELTQPEILSLNDFKAIDGGQVFEKSFRSAKNMLLEGGYVPMFLFAGKATRLNRGAMFSLDPWSIAEEEGYAQSGDKSNIRLGMGPRQIMAYRLKIERLAREEGLNPNDILQKQKLVFVLNDEVENEVLENFVRENFYGFDPSKIYFVNQPEFHGYRLQDGELVLDETSPALVFGHGDNVQQLVMQREAYQIDLQRQKKYLEQSILEEIGDVVLASHRVNDLTKFSMDTVVDLEKLAMASYLHEDQGFAITADLVSNPLKSKGGTASNLGLLETLAAKGDSFLMSFIESQGEQGAPYNAFRLTYKVPELQKVLQSGSLKYYLRFYKGFFYLEAVTGDLTHETPSAFLQRPGDVIKDFKSINSEQMTLLVNALREQDEQIKDEAGFQRLALEDVDLPQGADPAMVGRDDAFTKGGIDLNPALNTLDIDRAGAGFVLPPVDPAMLRQIQNAPGLVPVIIQIAPVVNLPMLLGWVDSPETEPTFTGNSIPYDRRSLWDDQEVSYLN